jgi:hypothetical protein
LNTHRVFNYRLCRGGRNIECSFGIFANKWRIFHHALNVDEKLCEDIVKVCCTHHNFVRDRDGYRIEDTLSVDGLFDMEPYKQASSTRANKLKDKFSDYFMSEEGGKWKESNEMLTTSDPRNRSQTC